MFDKIRCIHVAVNDVEAAAREYADNFGMEILETGSSEEMGMKNALLKVGDSVIELIEPLQPGEGPIAKFLERKGEGVYMTALEVDNIDAAIADLRSRNVTLINDDPDSRAAGIPVFIHPKSARGLMIELLEKPE